MSFQRACRTDKGVSAVCNVLSMKISITLVCHLKSIDYWDCVKDESGVKHHKPNLWIIGVLLWQKPHYLEKNIDILKVSNELEYIMLYL
jgi:hypothetical protein